MTSSPASGGGHSPLDIGAEPTARPLSATHDSPHPIQPAPVKVDAVVDFRLDVGAIARLGGPLLINNLSITGMSFADTVMAGRLGATDLAGLAIGVAWYNLFLFIGLGLFMAVSPAIAHAYGAANAGAVTRYLRQSVWLVLAVSLVLVTGLWQVRWALPALGIAPEIIPVAVGYVHAMSFGLPGLMAFFALRFASEGLGHTRPIMFIASGGLMLNVIGNWIFMYGKFGMPRLGAIGCGVATAITVWMMFLAMLAYMRGHRIYRRFAFFARLEPPDFRVLRELLWLGLPIAGSVLAEGGLFVAAALLMGAMGTTITGAHQIALNFAAFMFMVPLAISSATTIHVGHLLGGGNAHRARRAGIVGVCMCAGVMMISACGIVAWKDAIAALYTGDVVVQGLAATLLLAAAVFQVSDGVQVGAAGALRGFKDTAVPMALCWFSYWLVGFSLAYTLGVRRNMGPLYVWVGLIAGLTVCAALLMGRYLWISAARLRPVQR
ncbi:MAG TPA: MATE family efflux transporter [Steroidobacteraceae bacterium]|jgi:MATE family multidrug resistance protein